jgi:hypothetical protein
MKDTLTIHWKKYLGDRMSPCLPPQQETFKNVTDPWKVLNRRVKENIAYAVYNGVFLIRGMKVAKTVEPPATAVSIHAPEKKKGFIDKVGASLRSVFRTKLFSRQKH